MAVAFERLKNCVNVKSDSRSWPD